MDTAAPPRIPIDALERRFLKPDRRLLAGLREQARRVASVPALICALGPEHFGADWHTHPRWFRMTRSEALRTPPSRTDEHGRPWLAHPPSLAAAVLYLSDLPALLVAEQAALCFARALWAAQEALGIARVSPEPPSCVVWSLNGRGSTPGAYDVLDMPAVGTLRQLYSFVRALPPHMQPPDAVNPGWTGAFREIVDLANLQGCWSVGIAQGLIPEGTPDPLPAFLEIWHSGLGIVSISEGGLHLFVPERADTPTRRVDTHKTRDRKEQLLLDTLLLSACADHRTTTQKLEELLSRGADPNALTTSTPYGYGPNWPALSLLALVGPHVSSADVDLHCQRIRALLAAGAAPGRPDPQGLNPLARAFFRWLGPGVALWLEAGFPPNATDSNGRTALHQAAILEAEPKVRGALVSELLRAECAVDATDTEGMTPLHRALWSGHDDLLDPLLEAGADPHRITADGRTTYHLALTGLSSSNQRLASVILTLAKRGVKNTPDSYGWLPYLGQLEGTPPPLPEPTQRSWEAFGAARQANARVPEGLVATVHDGKDNAWEVLGDWFQQEDDIRGDLIALSLAEHHRQVPQGSYEAELLCQRPLLLAPFAQAHPTGTLLDRTAGVSLSFRKGVLWDLALPGSVFASGLSALLETPATALLHGLTLSLPLAGMLDGAIPANSLFRRLEITIERGVAEAVLPSEDMPRLVSVLFRTLGARLVVHHGSLQVLRLEQPYQPTKAWSAPAERLDTPALHTLSVIASRAPQADDPAMPWLLDTLDHPPPLLRALELRPVSVVLFEAFIASPVLEQLHSLVLSSAQPPILPLIEANAAKLAHLEHLEISLVGTQRAFRTTAQSRLRMILPKIELKGIEYRKVGKY